MYVADAIEIAMIFGEGQNLHRLRSLRPKVVRKTLVVGQQTEVTYVTEAKAGSEETHRPLTIKAYEGNLGVILDGATDPRPTAFTALARQIQLMTVLMSLTASSRFYEIMGGLTFSSSVPAQRYQD
ncbi:hypothetical protein LTR36_010063 [Oleoguttula mirabilis]|uniref:Uncharacterized protein n=1 Tax=Oleoguttula mirabilis TaxID=1507867 RepID=A0AAV9JRU4_9PEZI|nr:hypothetical protein LTR36_010063 [Oleoguttula mirabilis]